MRIAEEIEEKLREIKYLDFTEEYRKKYTEQIKQAYKTKCFQDNTLSTEFKKHLKNSENITVDFQYGYDLKVDLYSLKVNAHYYYKYSYKSGEHLSGTASINSYGEVNTSGVSVVSDYNTTTYSSDDTVSIYPTGLKKLTFSTGKAYYQEKEKDNYKSYSIKNMPLKLKTAFDNTTVTIADFEKNLKTQCLQDNYVRSQAENFIKKICKPYIPNITINDVCDYGVSYFNLYFMPCGFVIKTVFNGKTYESSQLFNINNIESFGELSSEFKIFEKAEKAQEEKSAFSAVPMLFTILSIVIMGFSFYGMLFGLLPTDRGLINSVNYDTVGCWQHSLYGLFIFGPIGIDCILLKWYSKKYENTVPYRNDIQINTLIAKVEKKYKKALTARILFSVFNFIFTIIWFYLLHF